MSSPISLFQIGVEAVQQKRFADAIPALEAFCHSSTRPTKERLQAQMHLVQAYYKGGQPENAIALCQHLAANAPPNAPPNVQTWATNLLTSLTPAATPDPAVVAPEPDASPAAPSALLNDTKAAQLLKQGNKALKIGKFADAVEHLKTYIQQSDPQHKDYAQAQMWLVKA